MIFKTEHSAIKDLEVLDFKEAIWLTHWYPQICQFLGIDPKEDKDALLNALAITSSNITPDVLKQLMLDKSVFAIAPGIYLEDELDEYLKRYNRKEDILISADGATSYLISQNIIPHIIVTDLDGNVEDQLTAQKKGSILLIHVHGDNYHKIQKYFEDISNGRFLLTTQIQPLPGSFNFYGFTDGDRIVCLSTVMSAKEIFLIGYDFGSEIGKYSKDGSIDDELKARKMKKFIIGKSVINWCSNTGQSISFLINRE